MKNVSVWECQSCGAQSPVWSGQCMECGKWNTLVESIAFSKLQITNHKSQTKFKSQITKPEKLSEILKSANASQRISTQIGELDRVLGEGMIPGSVMLLAGEPGMGKSTLLSQVALKMSTDYSLQTTVRKTVVGSPPAGLPAGKAGEAGQKSVSILYICGEESPSQVAMRLHRLAKSQSHLFEPEGSQSRRPEERILSDEGLYKYNVSLFAETNVDAILAAMGNTKPSLVIIDSIQTLHTDDLSGMAGSVGQIRECAGRLSQVAKKLNIPLFLIGHITKEGEIAGPKVLEHMVDVVLTLEGERIGNLRFVRAVKNRFGPVDEVGIFSMEEGGMREVINPAELLIGDLAGKSNGSVLGCVMEGQRPLIIEVQALTVSSKLPVPRRIGHGVRIQKLQLLCAVIEKHLGPALGRGRLGIGDRDVYVNVAGGLSSQDPGLDLAIVAAIVSSLKQTVDNRRSKVVVENRKWKIDSDNQSSTIHARPQSSIFNHPSSSFIFCGEVGLLGEVRQVAGWERREKEVKRLKLGKLIGKNSVRHIRELQGYLK